MGVKEALADAIGAIHEEDGHDLFAVLFRIVKALDQEAFDLLEEDEHAAYKKYVDN